ncbi:DUF1772 domain-containing protein [Hoeflea sp.]|uniref:anthrone oxygenase family protein n=1 Tax=Hoeflea sp. TaxID=1940281 RepID=UPI00374A24CF
MITTRILPFTALLLTAAIFGFFYAWVCSTMWGLDTLEPALAIQAMQAMNASVRNAVFFPAFFLTPVALLVTAVALSLKRHKAPAVWFAAAAMVYLVGGFGVTALVNVPMNQALAAIDIGTRATEAGNIWQAYSDRWQFWNSVRTVASALAVVLSGMAFIKLGQKT